MLAILKKIAQIGVVTETQQTEPLRPVTELPLIQQAIVNTFGRSLAIRHVDAGSCNACELELHALHNPYYNIEGLGIHFTASPRHADLLLVTGPLSRNMILPLQRTYEAMPDPKFVVAVGGCACTGGLFGETYATCGSVSKVIPVDLHIQGCPPSPLAILQGIQSLVNARIK